jgi:hypothetical protein
MLNGKIHYFDWAIFNSKLLVYQRVLRHIATCDQIQMLSWGNLKRHCPLGKLVQHFEELQVAAKWPVGAHKLLFPAKISNIATSAPHIPKLRSQQLQPPQPSVALKLSSPEVGAVRTAKTFNRDVFPASDPQSTDFQPLRYLVPVFADIS